jgi:uncharacterized protein YoxC
MTVGAIAALVAAIAVAVLVLFLIPTILTVRRTAESVASLADLLTTELKPTIKELNEVLAELKTVGGGVAEHTDDVKKFMSALGETGDQIKTINRSVNNVTSILGQAGAFATGIKVGARYLLENYLKNKMKGV